jgi:hypothetical protein
MGADYFLLQDFSCAMIFFEKFTPFSDGIYPAKNNVGSGLMQQNRRYFFVKIYFF